MDTPTSETKQTFAHVEKEGQMNNYQWLLQMDGAERKAWFDAEHVETEERALDGDTEPQNADSRELLDADVRKWCGEYAYQADMVWTWLDRQAAITEEKTRYKWVTASAEEIAAWRSKAEKLKEQVCELTAERDKLQEQLRIGWECECKLQAERERYREKFGKCLDYADAIHALMDDEGMA
jgi:hypothetical protein